VLKGDALHTTKLVVFWTLLPRHAQYSRPLVRGGDVVQILAGDCDAVVAAGRAARCRPSAAIVFRARQEGRAVYWTLCLPVASTKSMNFLYLHKNI
jgi:hypothetical protein